MLMRSGFFRCFILSSTSAKISLEVIFEAPQVQATTWVGHAAIAGTDARIGRDFGHRIAQEDTRIVSRITSMIRRCWPSF